MFAIQITAAVATAPSPRNYYAAAELAAAGHSVTLLLPDQRAWAELQREHPQVASRVESVCGLNDFREKEPAEAFSRRLRACMAAPVQRTAPVSPNQDFTRHRLRLCQVLLNDCVLQLGLDSRLCSATANLVSLLLELPKSHAGSPPSESTYLALDGPFGNAHLAEIGAALPALLNALQARQGVPSPLGFPSVSSSPHSTRPA